MAGGILIINFFVYVSAGGGAVGEAVSFLLQASAAAAHALAQEGIPVTAAPQDWLFWTLLALAAFLAFIRMAYGGEFAEFATVFRRWGYRKHLLRELSAGIPIGWVLLNLFAILVFSTFAALMAMRYDWLSVRPEWLGIVLFTALGILLLAGRYLTIRLAALILPDAEPLRFFLYYEFQLLRLGGVLLFPLMLLTAFAEPPVGQGAMVAALGLLALLFLLRLVKGLTVAETVLRQRPLHFFLYLCSLEIAPLVVLVRFFLNVGPLNVAL